MPGVGGPPSAFDETVVATAAAERVLRRVERAALELERGAAVVVEAADELAVDRERDVEGAQAGLHGVEVRGRVVAVEVGDRAARRRSTRRRSGRLESSTRSGFLASVTRLSVAQRRRRRRRSGPRSAST